MGGKDEVSYNPPDLEQGIGDDEVKLSDGRIVKMRETNGADEAAVVQILGDHVSLQGAGAQVLVQANTLKAIVSIDGAAPPIFRSYNDYKSFARQFKTKDLNKLVRKYTQMNMELDPDNPLA